MKKTLINILIYIVFPLGVILLFSYTIENIITNCKGSDNSPVGEMYNNEIADVVDSILDARFDDFCCSEDDDISIHYDF